MKINRSIFFIALISWSFVIVSCQKDNDDHDHTHEDPKLILKMDHKWKNTNLYIDESKSFTLDNGQTITLTEFRYYLTNLELKRTDGTWWQEMDSYRIVDAANQIDSIVIEDIPEGDYTDIRFLIGVDSLRNFSGAQDGALSPSNEMFWSWNSGYIFVKVEGISDDIEGADPVFQYHIGGFKDPFKASRTFEDSFSGELIARKNAIPAVHFEVYADRFFQGESIDINVNAIPRMHMPNENTVKVADNYANMIKLDHINN